MQSPCLNLKEDTARGISYMFSISFCWHTRTIRVSTLSIAYSLVFRHEYKNQFSTYLVCLVKEYLDHNRDIGFAEVLWSFR